VKAADTEHAFVRNIEELENIFICKDTRRKSK